MQMLRALESRRVHHRGDRRDHRPGASAGRRARRSARWTSPGIDVLAHVAEEPADVSSCRAASVAVARRARMDRREGRPGLLQARDDAIGGSEILTLDPATLDLSPEAVAAAARARGRAIDRGRRRADQDAVPRAGQGRRSSCAPRSGRRCVYTARGRARHRATRSTMSTARCGGASAGSWGRSRSATRSASRSARRRLPSADDLPPLVAEARAPARDRFRDDGVPPAAPDLQILRVREGSPARRPQERRREPRRPRRRRAGASSSTRR